MGWRQQHCPLPITFDDCRFCVSCELAPSPGSPRPLFLLCCISWPPTSRPPAVGANGSGKSNFFHGGYEGHVGGVYAYGWVATPCGWVCRCMLVDWVCRWPAAAAAALAQRAPVIQAGGCMATQQAEPAWWQRRRLHCCIAGSLIHLLACVAHVQPAPLLWQQLCRLPCCWCCALLSCGCISLPPCFKACPARCFASLSHCPPALLPPPPSNTHTYTTRSHSVCAGRPLQLPLPGGPPPSAAREAPRAQPGAAAGAGVGWY